MAVRIGVDVGGTFTDVVVQDGSETAVAKTPTVPDAAEVGVLNGVASVFGDGGLRRADVFLHGTTVGLNALLTRSGASVALVSTLGFRDVLEIRRADRARPYDPFWAPPTPLVPRSRRYEVEERIAANGAVLVPLSVADLARVADRVRETDVDSVAIAFINCYANSEHEEAAYRLLAKQLPGVSFSVSSYVSREYREYERTSTTVVDALIKPKVSRYIEDLERGLRGGGFAGNALITRSGGGALSLLEASQRPFETLMSGPVAGVAGAAALGDALGYPNLITADVGGTSFDACLVSDGLPHLLFEGSVDGIPIQASWVDVRSIGAGGGSIARLDASRLLAVGPESAGARPGPACYGHGGTDPTVTDALFVLGLLGNGELASGLRLNRDAADSVHRPLAAALELDVVSTAIGIVRIAAAAMADAIREITVERGDDPRSRTLVMFGGAGPTFGSLIASELGISSILVPPHAGNFSAWGLLCADIVSSTARTRLLPLTSDGLRTALETAHDLFGEIRGRRSEPDGGDADARQEIFFDIRYPGQEHHLTLPVSLGDLDDRDVGRMFAKEYNATFGYSLDQPPEIVAIRANVRTVLPKPAFPSLGTAMDIPDGATWQTYSFRTNRFEQFALVPRQRLVQGALLRGPALLLEETTMTYVDSGVVANGVEDGVALLSLEPNAMSQTRRAAAHASHG